jgi:hypothetical protein
MDMQSEDAAGLRTGPIVVGAILLALGTAMLLNSTGVIDVHLGRFIGPLVLIAIGSSIVLGQNALVLGHCEPTADGSRRRHRRRGAATGGIYLIGLGVWLLISQNHFFGLTFATSWPLLIILSGFMIVIRGMR